jgi:hypothetical protein
MSNLKSSVTTTKAVVARIQSAVAIKNGGQTPKGNHVTRMQRVAAKAQSKSGPKTK